jgi:hypothetical protein
LRRLRPYLQVHPDDAPEDRKKDFHPEFSWLLFEEEKIFGYKEPKIDVSSQSDRRT